MIIQGSNQPIILEFDENTSSIQKISCVLYNESQELKKWDLDNILKDGNNLILNLTEKETLEFPEGTAVLEIKWLEDGNVEFAEKAPILIIDRKDETKLVGVE